MSAPTRLLAPEDTAAALDGGPFTHFDGALQASFTTTDFRTALELVNQVAVVAESMNHHPDVTVGYGTVSFRLSSHDAGGVTARDLRLAARIRDVAESLGAEDGKAEPARYDIAIDCTDADAIRAFWRVGLGYQESRADDVDLVHPQGLGPRIWFQHMEIARTDRNRIHLDVYVPTAEAESRVQDILDAGGVLLTDEHAPEWWVLADAEGNELCVCTSPR